MEDITDKSPAYGSIVVTHKQGSKRELFGSDLQHSTTITLSIHPSEITFENGRDWIYSSLNSHIEVEMTPLQWAEMLTSIGQGEGTPCTIRRLNGERIVMGKRSQTKEELFSNQAKETLSRAMERLSAMESKLSEALSDKKALGMGKISELRDELAGFKRELESNLPFVLKAFAEQMETIVADAKRSVEAYTENAIRSKGLEGLSVPTMIERE